MIFTIRNRRIGAYHETVVRSMKELRREIKGESPRNLSIKAQKSIDHEKRNVVLLEGPRGGISIHID
jgi:hypothetical protein